MKKIKKWKNNQFGLWGDKNVDWRGINDAAEYIGEGLKRWGRVDVRQWKEKFASCRIYCSIGWHCLLNITHPGHVYYTGRYPKWLATFDIYVGHKVVPFLFNWVIRPYHKWLYRHFYKTAVKKWPHLEKNILCCADYPELLKGIGDEKVQEV